MPERCLSEAMQQERDVLSLSLFCAFGFFGEIITTILKHVITDQLFLQTDFDEFFNRHQLKAKAVLGITFSIREEKRLRTF